MPKLIRVHPAEDPGYRRVRAGRGFRYLDDHGAALPEAERERIDDLVIPPAWTDVWISKEAMGHIQVVGTDDAGRRQYIYHPRWTQRRDRGKYARALALADSLPRARAKATTALRREGLGRERVLATAFRLLDQVAPRVGSAKYFTSHGSRGLTTLQRRDAVVEASLITLSYPAKSGKRALLTIEDEDLATVVTELAIGRPRSALLSYERGRRRVPLSPSDVNAHVRALTGGSFTAKDFRTLRGTILAAEALAQIGVVDTKKDRKRAETLAVQATADGLGNTAAVARNSYIDPRVFDRYRRGRLLSLDGSRDAAIRALLLD
ncbi:topoisomerase I [Microbacterium sp. Root61]|uniref:DNA topoisomerase IB n=1 Tax=Microbacterium sp. Root61 TaxID=1736570 RepID=UPI0006F4B879|nr:DNA topoisomerase IB [Microbacterium sp. Root61]KRA25070.1 topoisomerase I [Microbacterium sp. Root61]